MISTRGMTGAGLKKCTPRTRSGFAQADAIPAIGSDDVLVARTQSGETAISSRANVCPLDVETFDNGLDDDRTIRE